MISCCILIMVCNIYNKSKENYNVFEGTNPIKRFYPIQSELQINKTNWLKTLINDNNNETNFQYNLGLTVWDKVTESKDLTSALSGSNVDDPGISLFTSCNNTGVNKITYSETMLGSNNLRDKISFIYIMPGFKCTMYQVDEEETQTVKVGDVEVPFVDVPKTNGLGMERMYLVTVSSEAVDDPHLKSDAFGAMKTPNWFDVQVNKDDKTLTNWITVDKSSVPSSTQAGEPTDAAKEGERAEKTSGATGSATPVKFSPHPQSVSYNQLKASNYPEFPFYDADEWLNTGKTRPGSQWMAYWANAGVGPWYLKRVADVYKRQQMYKVKPLMKDKVHDVTLIGPQFINLYKQQYDHHAAVNYQPGALRWKSKITSNYGFGWWDHAHISTLNLGTTNELRVFDDKKDTAYYAFKLAHGSPGTPAIKSFYRTMDNKIDKIELEYIMREEQVIGTPYFIRTSGIVGNSPQTTILSLKGSNVKDPQPLQRTDLTLKTQMFSWIYIRNNDTQRLYYSIKIKLDPTVVSNPNTRKLKLVWGLLNKNKETYTGCNKIYYNKDNCNTQCILPQSAELACKRSDSIFCTKTFIQQNNYKIFNVEDAGGSDGVIIPLDPLKFMVTQKPSDINLPTDEDGYNYFLLESIGNYDVNDTFEVKIKNIEFNEINYIYQLTYYKGGIILRDSYNPLKSETIIENPYYLNTNYKTTSEVGLESVINPYIIHNENEFRIYKEQQITLSNGNIKPLIDVKPIVLDKIVKFNKTLNWTIAISFTATNNSTSDNIILADNNNKPVLSIKNKEIKMNGQSVLLKDHPDKFDISNFSEYEINEWSDNSNTNYLKGRTISLIIQNIPALLKIYVCIVIVDRGTKMVKTYICNSSDFNIKSIGGKIENEDNTTTKINHHMNGAIRKLYLCPFGIRGIKTPTESTIDEGNVFLLINKLEPQ